MENEEYILKYVKKLRVIKDEMLDEGFKNNMAPLLPLINSLNNIIAHIENDDIEKFTEFVYKIQDQLMELSDLHQRVMNIEGDIKTNYAIMYDEIKDQIDALKKSSEVFSNDAIKMMDALDKACINMRKTMKKNTSV